MTVRAPTGCPKARIENTPWALPLMVAAKSGSFEVVSTLLKAHADARARNKRGLNALHWAATGRDFDQIVTLLLASGTHPADRITDGKSALDNAIQIPWPSARLLTIEMLEL